MSLLLFLQRGFHTSVGMTRAHEVWWFKFVRVRTALANHFEVLAMEVGAVASDR